MSTRRRMAPEATVDGTRRGAETAQEGGRARLVSVFPPDHAYVLDLSGAPLEIGRGPEAPGSPPMPHPTISRRHAEVRWHDGTKTALVRDLGSRNGTWAAGRAARDRFEALGPGEILRVGDVLFVLEDGATLDAPEVSRVSQENIPGGSLPARNLRRSVLRAAPDVSPALVIGETGTGKEKIAKEIHRLSGRTGPLIPVNCATLGAHLIESQLFGHTKGAFTGADTDREGLFVAARGGTLFLDEIGEMPLELQPKLLRAIQEKEIRAVGSTTTEKVDVRIVAATHADLAARARDGSFRQDLYARLAMWEIRVPPVRERRADIMSWMALLHRAWCAERDRPNADLELHVEAAEAILSGSWHENLRGLGRLVHELASSAPSGAIRRELIPQWALS